MKLVHPVVCRAVSRCFTDASISVRDAAVSLVGSYVLQTPAIADIFHNSLVLRKFTDKHILFKTESSPE